MLVLSLILFGAAFYLAAGFLKRRFESRLVMLERKRISMVEAGLSKEFWFIEPSRLKRKIRWALAIGALLSVVLFSPIPLFLLLGFVWFLPHGFLRLVQRRRQKKLERQLTTVLPAISASLRAGHTFERAIETLVRTTPPPISQEFELALKEIRLGATLDRALENLARRCPFRDLEIVVRAVQISARAGSNLAEAFDRVAETVRARASLRDRVAGLTAQGRLQAWVAIAMPIALTLILNLIAPEYLAPLFQTGVGRLLLGIAAVAMAAGGIWIHRISRREFSL